MASSADNDAMRTDSPEAEMPEERTSGDSADVTLPQVDFLAMQFPSSDREGEFATPEPSSGRHHSDDLADTFGDMTAAQRREIVADACRLDPAYAQRVLDSYSGRQLGWCELVSLVPNEGERVRSAVLRRCEQIRDASAGPTLGGWVRSVCREGPVFALVSPSCLQNRRACHR